MPKTRRSFQTKSLSLFVFLNYQFIRRLAKQGNGGPSGTRSSFQRACARFGPHIVEPTPTLVKRRVFRLAPRTGERNHTESNTACQPPSADYFSWVNGRTVWERKGKRGEGSKARKTCLGWNSRQDGGRLAERSGNPSPYGFLLGVAVMP